MAFEFGQKSLRQRGVNKTWRSKICDASDNKQPADFAAGMMLFFCVTIF